MTETTALRFAVACFLAAASSLAASPEPIRSIEPTATELTQFLQEAQFVQRGPSIADAEHSYLATLSDGNSDRIVAVQTVTPYRYQGYKFRDSLVYNVVAYKLDRMLQAGVVPCTVLRKANGAWASVTAAAPGSGSPWEWQGPRTEAFRALIGAVGPSYADAFLAHRGAPTPRAGFEIDAHFSRALQSLNRKLLKAELGEWLSKSEIQSLLDRRDDILAHSRTSGAATSAKAD